MMRHRVERVTAFAHEFAEHAVVHRLDAVIDREHGTHIGMRDETRERARIFNHVVWADRGRRLPCARSPRYRRCRDGRGRAAANRASCRANSRCARVVPRITIKLRVPTPRPPERR